MIKYATLIFLLFANSISFGQPFSSIQNSPLAVITELVIGYTYYDFQTPGAICNSLVRNSDGSFSAVWTFSPDTLNSFPNRGTAYNYYDPTATTLSKWYYHPDGGAGSFPSVRTEGSLRTGFSNIVVTDNGSEMTIAHCNSPGTQHLLLNWRAAKGPGNSWIVQTGALDTGTNNDTWAKATSSGNTVYVIAHGTGVTGNPLYAQDGPILFSKSDDAGLTWPVLRQPLPLIDSNFYAGFGADGYSIDAHDSTVAIVFSSTATDLGILKSTDWGNTWTKTIVKSFPIPFFDFNTDFTYLPNTGPAVDTMESNNGDATVLIDNNGLCHVWYGFFRWFRDSSTASGFYTPLPQLSDGLYYWNESMPTDSAKRITGMQDFNGNGQMDYPVARCLYPWGEYGNLLGRTSRPSAGVDENNAIYVSYMSLVEGGYADTSLWHELHSHIFVMGSSDLGRTWTSPIDIVPNAAAGGSGEYQDAAFGCMARNVIASEGPSILYQRDSVPGSVAGGFICHFYYRPNEMVFAQVQVPVGKVTEIENNKISSSFSPNPFSETATLEIQLINNEEITLQLFDVLAKKVAPEIRISGTAGIHRYPIDLKPLKSGLYFYRVQSGTRSGSGKMIKM